MDKPPVDLLQTIAQHRALIDEALCCHLRMERACPQRLRQAIHYSLMAPGKRLRPTLVLMAAEACGGDVQEALPAACAVEMIHAYSLVHDDLPAMDDDDLRRGRPTCHRQFDEATAILAGDGLLTLAFKILASKIRPGEVAAECCEILAEAAGICGMVGGQADDMEGGLAAENLERVESIHARKTGALITASLLLGALVAGAARPVADALEQYGRRLGLAFQIVDDLLDVRGDAARVGKRLGKDAERGKVTFPALMGIDESMHRAERLLEEACQALDLLGARGESLKGMASYVLERNR